MNGKIEINSIYGIGNPLVSPAYAETDSFQIKSNKCTIVWVHGEITELKGKNALQIARNWLYNNDDVLLVHTDGWIYLKDLEKRVTYGD